MADGYFQAFSKIWNHCWIEWEVRGPRNTFLRDFIYEVCDYGFITVNDILLCLVLGLFITILRYFLTIAVFKPLFKWSKLLEKDQKKCPESAFKFLSYSSLFAYCCYVLFNGDNDLFHDTNNCWRGWYKGMPVAQDIYILYVVEAGFYFHSIYATLFMDQWRRDSILMIMHHILTNALILFSLAIRYHRIGVIVIFLHDVCDIFLEFSKLCVAFKSRDGKYHLGADILSGVGFTLFAALWFFCRLYLYPIKVLLSCGGESRPYAPTAPFYFFFNSMLWILFFMNLWWFQYIIWLLIRIVTGMSKGVEDTREIPKHKMTNGKVVENGDVSVANHALHSTNEDTKRRDENVGDLSERDNKEQFRRRQPRTKPANP